MKRVKITFVLLLVAIVGAIVWRTLTERPQPVYQGKTADAWLDGMTNYNSGRNYADSRTALEHIGSQAVPFIFRKLAQNDSPLRNKYRDSYPKWPGFIRKILPQPRPMTFDVMTAERSLSACGTSNETQTVINKLNDGNPALRELAWEFFRSFAGRFIATNDAMALCIPALKDEDAMVRLEAAMCLGSFGAAASNAVPALSLLLSSSETGRRPSARYFVRANTALTLGHIGPPASGAVPALTNLVATGDNYARVCAAVALWEITSNENLALPVIMRELPTFNQYTKPIPINTLKAMGPRAKAAFPLLLSELPHAVDAEQGEVITNALKAIDPDAAAKAGIK